MGHSMHRNSRGGSSQISRHNEVAILDHFPRRAATTTERPKKMAKIVIAFTATLLGMFVLVSPADCKIGRSIKPLAGLETVSLEVIVGGALELSGGGAMHLFMRDFQRADAFERKLSREVRSLLLDYGIRMSPGQDAAIIVTAYGRPTAKPDKDHYYIFLLEVSLPYLPSHNDVQGVTPRPTPSSQKAEVGAW